MGENFMSAITQIADLITKKKQIIERAASLISEACMDRIHNGTMSRTTEKDIQNAVKDFSKDEQVDILIKAIVLLSMNRNTAPSYENDEDDNYTYKKKKNSRSDIFRR